MSPIDPIGDISSVHILIFLALPPWPTRLQKSIVSKDLYERQLKFFNMTSLIGIANWFIIVFFLTVTGSHEIIEIELSAVIISDT